VAALDPPSADQTRFFPNHDQTGFFPKPNILVVIQAEPPITNALAGIGAGTGSAAKGFGSRWQQAKPVTNIGDLP
jgi:hypothetical protein